MADDTFSDNEQTPPASPLKSPISNHRIPRILSVANQKGGVGKTTTSVNLATALAAIGKKVLLVDLDSQGNASTGLGIKRAGIRKSTYDVIFDDASVAETVQATKVPGLFVLPSSIHLSGAEIELVTTEHREFRLQRALRVPMPYDYVVIDCPPSLSLLTLNALVASDAIVVPLQCEFFALEGLSHLVKTIERVKKSFNPRLDIHGIVLTMFDKRNNLSDQVAADVRDYFGDKVYKTVIPRNVRLSEAPSYGLPAIVYDMKCPGARAYISLASEILKREKKLRTEAAAQASETTQAA
ncbi:MAG: chromosome partitioning protein ParA [Micavibrio aeruginosavorus]|uniref:Chromosome partitioning protein ParA n=1 Tax=Micavibrio aeruginosavorus TaxID=349221 RepID=A0A2W5N942_9BACT|nr:MAG: chromosome partitioning protein ParA [Micavibrio aeruginosavorus]